MSAAVVAVSRAAGQARTRLTRATVGFLIAAAGRARRMHPVVLGLCLLVVVVLPWMLTAGAGSALAADDTKEHMGQFPATFDWIGIKDSHGVPVDRFELSIDDGGLNSPDLFVWQVPLHALWGFYWGFASIGIWFMDWALSFGWIDWIYQPMNTVGVELHQVMSRFGIAGSLATIAACLVAFTFVRGKTVTALWDYFMIVAVLCVAASSFANPVEKVLGPSGYVMTAHDWTMEAVSNLAVDANPDGSSAPVFDAHGGQMPITSVFVDTFIRIPQQFVNFGHELDDKCQSVYTDALKAGPYGGDGDLRDKVGECDPAAKTRGDAPGAGMFADLNAILPAGAILVLFAIVLAGSVIVAAFNAGWKAVRANFDLITGVLPGVFRSALAATIAEIIIAVGMVVVSIFFAALYVVVVASVMRGHDDWPAAKTFVVVDVVMLVGLVVFIRQRGKAKHASAQLQRAMLFRPNGPSTPVAAGRSDGLMRGVMAAQACAGLVRMARRSSGTGNGAGAGANYWQLNTLFMGGASHGDGQGAPVDLGTLDVTPAAQRGPRALPAGRRAIGIGHGSEPLALGPGPSTPAPSTPSTDLTSRLRRSKTVNALVPLVSTAAQAGLAHATGGTSAVAVAGVRAATTLRSMRQDTLRDKLANPSTSVPTRPGTTPTPAAPSTTRVQVVTGEVVSSTPAQTLSAPTRREPAPTRPVPVHPQPATPTMVGPALGVQRTQAPAQPRQDPSTVNVALQRQHTNQAAQRLAAKLAEQRMRGRG